MKFPHTAFTRRHLVGAFALAFVPALTPPKAMGQTPDTRPTVFLIGDSTVKNGTKGQQGWGDPFAALFDSARLRVENRARGGRSSRTFLTEGLWAETLALVKPGDIVLIQFGHNDGGPMDEGRARASINGNGTETRDITIKETGKKETVLTYGAYLRCYITDAKAKGAIPIVLSPVPRNRWSDATTPTVLRANTGHGLWAKEAAQMAGAHFVDLNEIIARSYEVDGKAKVASFFTSADWTHTNPDGAKRNAECVLAGLKALGISCPSALLSGLSASGQAVTPAPKTLAIAAPTAPTKPTGSAAGGVK